MGQKLFLVLSELWIVCLAHCCLVVLKTPPCRVWPSQAQISIDQKIQEELSPLRYSALILDAFTFPYSDLYFLNSVRWLSTLFVFPLHILRYGNFRGRKLGCISFIFILLEITDLYFLLSSVWKQLLMYFIWFSTYLMWEGKSSPCCFFMAKNKDSYTILFKNVMAVVR